MSDARQPFLAAAAQLTAGGDVEANLANCLALGADAAARGCQLLVLPECFAYIGQREADKLAIAEVIDGARPGRILGAVLEIAARYRMWVVAGGMPERVGPGGDPALEGKAWNTCVAVSPEGSIAGIYRKIHLFDVAIPGKAEFRESASTAAGNRPVAVATPLGRIGLSICYDLRFPELYRRLTHDQGAEILVVPAAFTAHTGEAHWEVLLRARAIENQCFVIGAGQTGQHHPARRTFGHSTIIDPWGLPLATLEAGTGLVVAPIDLARLDRVRQEMPCGAHRVL